MKLLDVFLFILYGAATGYAVYFIASIYNKPATIVVYDQKLPVYPETIVYPWNGSKWWPYWGGWWSGGGDGGYGYGYGRGGGHRWNGGAGGRPWGGSGRGGNGGAPGGYGGGGRGGGGGGGGHGR